MELIPSDKLTVDMLPGTDAGREAFIKFAYTFDGYELFEGETAVEKCGAFANQASAAFKADGTLPDSLDELRACLFFEQRADYHGGFDLDDTVPPYYHALVAAMREIISRR
jgi:hypothetical protein